MIPQREWRCKLEMPSTRPLDAVGGAITRPLKWQKMSAMEAAKSGMGVPFVLSAASGLSAVFVHTLRLAHKCELSPAASDDCPHGVIVGPRCHCGAPHPLLRSGASEAPTSPPSAPPSPEPANVGFVLLQPGATMRCSCGTRPCCGRHGPLNLGVRETIAGPMPHHAKVFCAMADCGRRVFCPCRMKEEA